MRSEVLVALSQAASASARRVVPRRSSSRTRTDAPVRACSARACRSDAPGAEALSRQPARVRSRCDPGRRLHAPRSTERSTRVASGRKFLLPGKSGRELLMSRRRTSADEALWRAPRRGAVVEAQRLALHRCAVRCGPSGARGRVATRTGTDRLGTQRGQPSAEESGGRTGTAARACSHGGPPSGERTETECHVG